jgi:hypothetical protein
MITPYDRREFLRVSTSWLAFMSAHDWLTQKMRPAAAGRHHLLRLRLLSAAPPLVMRQFYGEVLGLPVSARGDTIGVTAGATELLFTYDRSGGPRPFYHFAFNIPENKIVRAHEWQQQRTPLLPISSALRDPAMPPEVVHYRHWNAHSVFFFDPAGNVVEYIARHDLRNPASGPFEPSDILYASEIAFVVDDVLPAVPALAEVSGLSTYGSSSDAFAALGDERGLLLIMKRGRVISFEDPQKKAVDVFATAVVLDGAQPSARRPFRAFPYEVSGP